MGVCARSTGLGARLPTLSRVLSACLLVACTSNEIGTVRDDAGVDAAVPDDAAVDPLATPHDLSSAGSDLLVPTGDLLGPALDLTAPDLSDAGTLPLVDAATTPDGGSYPGKLEFHSGFEGNVAVVPTLDPQMDKLTGTDFTLPAPNDWVADYDEAPGVGSVRLAYEGGNVTQRRSGVIPEPGNPTNHVLEFWLAEPNVVSPVKGRVQMSVYGNTPVKDMFIAVRAFLPSDFATFRTYPGVVTWMTVLELWNNGGWTGEQYPFRITVNVVKPSATVPSPIYFSVHGQTLVNDQWINRWEVVDTSFAIPDSKWLKLEYYFKQGDASTGRFYMAVTPSGDAKRVLFDVHDFTYHPDDPAPDGMRHYNPVKLYTSANLINHFKGQGKALQILWDDFEIWSGRAP